MRDGDFPYISIVVPCLNEEKYIAKCLDSVIAGDYPRNSYELLCVDGGSVDGTRSIIQDYTKSHTSIRLLDNPKQIRPAGLNVGITNSKGDPVVCLDAHSTYPGDYLSKCVDTLRTFKVDNVGGLFITFPREDTAIGRAIATMLSSSSGVGNAVFRVGADEVRQVDTVPYGCYQREVFSRMGLFDERLVRNADVEFNSRIIHAGGKIILNPEITLNYHCRSTVSAVLKEAFRLGKWNVWVWFLAPYAFTVRHAVPGAFVASVISSIIISLVTSWGWMLLAAIIGLYTLFVLISTIMQIRQSGWWPTLMLLFLFPAFHFTYGVGTVIGSLLLLLGRSSVQPLVEPWEGAGQYRLKPRSSLRADC